MSSLKPREKQWLTAPAQELEKLLKDKEHVPGQGMSATAEPLHHHDQGKGSWQPKV